MKSQPDARGAETGEGRDRQDFSSIDGIVKALYESVSFNAGGQPDYGRLRSLFRAGARLVPPRTEKETRLSVIDVDTFITRSSEYVVITGLERKGFIEKEVSRRSHSFGMMAQVFSTYESHQSSADSPPISRGINSIQLVKEGGRWWVVSIVWDVERPGNPIPKAYLT